MYKNQLQELAQRSCFNLPSYACIREGPDHAPRFKATVNFNGDTFESPTFFSTLRQAEHAAAEVALSTLADRGPSKTLAAKILDETGVYKNLLQETAHRAGLNLPVYTTVRSGPGHVPVFSCSVELAGMRFTGELAKTKKQAQKNAALSAWSALKQMSQHGSSSSAPATSGSHEEQEQVVVARFLASLNPAESSSSTDNNQQKGHHRSPTTCRNSFLSTSSTFDGNYQNWASSNASPEMAIYYMWMQQQAAEQQRRLMALPFPVPPIPTHSQIVPWMHSMLQPSHHPYGMTGEQLPLSFRPQINSTTSSSLYFPNQLVSDPIKTKSMVSIEEMQEEKSENSKLSPAEAPITSSLSSNGCELLMDEKQQKDDKQENLPQTINVTSAPHEVRENGLTEWASTRCTSSGPQPGGETRLQNPLGFESSRPNTRMTHAPTTSYRGNAGMALPTGSRTTALRPTQNFRTPVTPPRMQSGVSPYSVRPRPGRMQFGASHSPFMAPAVQIRSVVPVCSAAPPRRMTTPSQERPPKDDVRKGTTGEVSITSSKFGNLHL